LLRTLNPHLSIYGLYGGDERDLPLFKRWLGQYFEHIYVIYNKTKEWKWKNLDLALKDWYADYGLDIEFDRAYIVEWDLLFSQPLEKVYCHLHRNEVGITALVPYEVVRHKWYWLLSEPSKSEWSALLAYVKGEYGYHDSPFASLGPGVCLPKSFLKEFSELRVPELCHDEIRVPLFAQILGFSLKDTGFSKKWFDEEDERYFNCVGKEISRSVIEAELNANGRSVFHPVTQLFSSEFINLLIAKNKV
jgi:hypothetical protein